MKIVQKFADCSFLHEFGVQISAETAATTATIGNDSRIVAGKQQLLGTPYVVGAQSLHPESVLYLEN
jgi:hypothetical protein